MNNEITTKLAVSVHRMTHVQWHRVKMRANGSVDFIPVERGAHVPVKVGTSIAVAPGFWVLFWRGKFITGHRLVIYQNPHLSLTAEMDYARKIAGYVCNRDTRRELFRIMKEMV